MGRKQVSTPAMKRCSKNKETNPSAILRNTRPIVPNSPATKPSKRIQLNSFSSRRLFRRKKLDTLDLNSVSILNRQNLYTEKRPSSTRSPNKSFSSDRKLFKTYLSMISMSICLFTQNMIKTKINPFESFSLYLS